MKSQHDSAAVSNLLDKSSMYEQIFTPKLPQDFVTFLGHIFKDYKFGDFK